MEKHSSVSDKELRQESVPDLSGLDRASQNHKVGLDRQIPMEIELAERGQELHEAESELESELEILAEVEQFAETHDFLDLSEQEGAVIAFLVEIQRELRPLGMSLSDYDASPSLMKDLRGELESSISESNERKKETNSAAGESIDRMVNARLIELDATGHSLSYSLRLLESEFGDSLDEKTSMVLGKFRELTSAKLINDPKELVAVETLFFAEVGSDFTQSAFTGFVCSIYEEPDSVISEETKARIEERFKIPRHPIKTGRELLSTTKEQREDGTYEFDSPENALEFRPGVKSFVDSHGVPVVAIEGSRSKPIPIKVESLNAGITSAQVANYGIIRQTIYEELNQTTNLFGGGKEDSFGIPSVATIRKANRFYRTLVGKLTPDRIVSGEGILNLRCALRALKPGVSTTEGSVHSALSQIGILSNGAIQWAQVSKIGRILRRNRFFREAEQRRRGAAYQRLTLELRRLKQIADSPISENLWNNTQKPPLKHKSDVRFLKKPTLN